MNIKPGDLVTVHGGFGGVLWTVSMRALVSTMNELSATDRLRQFTFSLEQREVLIVLAVEKVHAIDDVYGVGFPELTLLSRFGVGFAQANDWKILR